MTFSTFGNGLEVRGILLDISKAFDNLRHNGLIYKLKNDIMKKTEVSKILFILLPINIKF